MNWRRLRMGLNTVLGLKQQGFFIPYRYADSVPDSRHGKAYGPVYSQMQNAEESMIRFIKGFADYSNELVSFGQEDPPAPRWKQDWFPRLDGASAYKMVRDLKPKHIIEIGSGHSTRFMMRAIKDGELNTDFTAIDPAPRADITSLPLTLIRNTVQEAGTEPFDNLTADDILFIDSSHIAMPGSDVDFLLLDILGGLPAGITVHIHDIFLPHDYPDSWKWRGYNEQQLVAPLLIGGGFRLLFSSQYAVHYLKDQLENSLMNELPIEEGAFETSLWLRKKS